MTEQDWMAGEDPLPMLKSLPSSDCPCERKFRLFAVACCRLLLTKVQVSSQAAYIVDMAEQYADGTVQLAELLQTACYANSLAEHACNNAGEDSSGYVVADCAALNAAWAVAQQESTPPDDNGLSELFKSRVATVQATQCDLLRDIFGNPFRPIAFNPAWRTADVLALARGIYEERAFDRMPILADALQDAGCDNDAILNHCLKANQVHIRGCWVLDLVLGKTGPPR